MIKNHLLREFYDSLIQNYWNNDNVDQSAKKIENINSEVNKSLNENNVSHNGNNGRNNDGNNSDIKVDKNIVNKTEFTVNCNSFNEKECYETYIAYMICINKFSDKPEKCNYLKNLLDSLQDKN